jgi:uncharacterized Zn-finger protein
MSHHTGELKYACEECGAKFASSTQLKRHLKNHAADSTGETALMKAV